MDPFNFKRVADPVYGTIGLSELEVRVINTRAFLRLRNVKQLGMAYTVFPGADYSRFAHSLGCCHTAGRILQSIRTTDPYADIDDDKIQLYRLAGLTHDIGHYPFSHAFEEALKEYYAGEIVEWPGEQPGSGGGPGFFKHERAGREVITQDREISKLLRQGEFDPDRVCAIFMRTDPTMEFANLISSDLDADRMDFLLRTAHHTGLPYGSVDLDYIISQMRLDADSNICVGPKALRAVDHMLLRRYFDYLQVSFHKTVAALELVLKDVVTGLLGENRLSCTRADVTEMIRNDKWFEFDDIALIQSIRSYANETAEESDRLKARSILHRTPPRLVYSEEFLDAREDRSGRRLYNTRKKDAQRMMADWAADFRIDLSRWYLWPRVMELTKIGSYEPIGAAADDGKTRSEQAARILVDDSLGESTVITTVPSSLMNIMSNYANYMLRVYVLLTPEEYGLKSEIAKRIREDLDA